VFGLFKARKYGKASVPEIRGEDHGIQIVLRDFPVRVSEDAPEKRIEYYTDFNPRLIDAIWKAIGNFDDFVTQAIAGPVCLDVTVKDAPAFRCEIRLSERRSKRDFIAEMPDALIKAFQSADIRR
jgi:hypothetical protein